MSKKQETPVSCFSLVEALSVDSDTNGNDIMNLLILFMTWGNSDAGMSSTPYKNQLAGRMVFLWNPNLWVCYQLASPCWKSEMAVLNFWAMSLACPARASRIAIGAVSKGEEYWSCPCLPSARCVQAWP